MKTHSLVSKTFPIYCAVYEIILKNNVEPGRPQMTIWHMRITCRITKATNTLIVGNTYCFFTATAIMQTRLNGELIRTWNVVFVMTTNCVLCAVGRRCLMTVV